MRSKLCFLILAVLFLFVVHLHPAYRVTVDGERLPGLYSSSQLRAGLSAARAAADEIVPNEAALPAVRVKQRFRLRPADGDSKALADALLRQTPGVVSADGVWLNGVSIGSVEKGSALLEQLYHLIREGCPAGARVGNLSGSLRIREVYSRPGQQIPCESMLSLVTELAPVFYVDGEGRIVTAA